MNDSTAYQMGQVAGVIIGIFLMLGICVFFVIALVKSFTKRSKGWIIAAVLSGLPFLVFLCLFMAGMVMGFKRAANRSTELNEARHGESSQLLTAAMSPVSGNSIAYEISFPWMNDWQENDSRSPFDHIFSYHDAYVGIIAEGIGVGTPQRVCDLTQKNLASKTSSFSATAPEPIEIDSHSWLTYDVTATLNGLNVKYRYYVYADTNYTFQIMTWTGPALFNHYAPVFNRVAKSFKMPK